MADYANIPVDVPRTSVCVVLDRTVILTVTDSGTGDEPYMGFSAHYTAAQARKVAKALEAGAEQLEPTVVNVAPRRVAVEPLPEGSGCVLPVQPTQESSEGAGRA